VSSNGSRAFSLESLRIAPSEVLLEELDAAAHVLEDNIQPPIYEHSIALLQAALDDATFDGSNLVNAILQAALDRAAEAVDHLHGIAILDAGVDQARRAMRIMRNERGTLHHVEDEGEDSDELEGDIPDEGEIFIERPEYVAKENKYAIQSASRS